MTDHVMKSPALPIVDDYGVIWLWDGEWLDLDYAVYGEPREPGSGFPAYTVGDVVEILIEGGFVKDAHKLTTNLRRLVHPGEQLTPAHPDIAGAVRRQTEEQELERQADLEFQAHLEYLRQLDEDPRMQDPFARPDWDGDPNEY